MKPTEKLGRDNVFHILRNPVRRGIILILGEKGQMGFTDLRKTFPDISVGTLYYHLDLLNQIVTQNTGKKYILTEEGKKVFAQVLKSEEHLIPVKTSVEAKAGVESPISFFLMSRLFSDISLRPNKYLATPFLAFLSLAFLAWLSHSIELLLFFIPVSGAQSLLVISSAGASLLGVYSEVDALTFLFYRRREGNLALLIATSVGFIPLVIYPLALYFAALLNDQAAFARSPFNLILTVFPQVFAVILISAGLSQAKGLRLDRSALIVLVVVYVNLILLYLLGYVQV